MNSDEERNKISNTVYGRIADSLRNAILAGKFAPGSRLKMVDLIKIYGTSQMPIREALQKLQGEGVIHIIPHRGAQIRPVDERFVRNIYELRFAIENFLVRKACEQMNQKILNQLIRAQQIYDDLAKKKDILKLIETNNVFHTIHNSVADNEEALNVIERTNSLLKALRIKYTYGRKRLDQISAEHHHLLQCFKKKDLQGALLTHSQHCENAKANLLNLMKTKKRERKPEQPAEDENWDAVLLDLVAS